jgi:Protein of unknown function (Hypoth_ymh)
MKQRSSSGPPSDNESIGDVWWFGETYRFFIEGLRGLRDHLRCFDKIKASFELAESDYDRLIDRMSRMVDWAKKRLDSTHSENDQITERNVTYGSLRLLKAGGLYRVHLLQNKREQVLQENPSIPRTLLAAIDEKIAQWRDKLEQGSMNGLEPADIFYEITDSKNRRLVMHEELLDSIQEQSEAEVSLKTKAITIPPYLEQIPVLDEGLRERCLPLIATIDRNSENEGNKGEAAVQFDSVVREMSVVLEDRIRKLAKLTSEKGKDLMSKAFSGSDPLIRFSPDSATQEGAHLLYRGYSGFVRNEVMHALVPTYTRERVLQLLGMVDYLLFLLTQATHRTENNAQM